MADSILRDKAKGFAKDIVFVCRDMKKDKKESVLINTIQLEKQRKINFNSALTHHQRCKHKK